ncbi:SorB family sulfite dehydrogenase c-type cytochrome subunit [Microbulbifer pacificus]|uniref:Cytochrome c n=1 Tax=Microbulbifer pacificus TaxID=407164 RepID=A0AAU0N2X1_9GAMM|nr:cytochrome c [Microbulbifer pacificus]WOX07120.1 cytochrome c [Microbulbifer pacificus]
MRKISLSRLALAALLILAAHPVLLVAAGPGEVQIDLPPETAKLKPGPGMDVANRNCAICHSVDYIYMQPPLTSEQWTATVMKMKNAFGAPIPDNEVATIVNYLLSQNGKN